MEGGGLKRIVLRGAVLERLIDEDEDEATPEGGVEIFIGREEGARVFMDEFIFGLVREGGLRGRDR